jgi:hypothetical protein
MIFKIQEIFGISNKIPITYVYREYVDKPFVRALERQKHIVIYGSSKQGKTSLRKKHLSEPDSIVIQCTSSTSRETIYKILLKEAGIEFSSSQTNTVSGKNKVGVSGSGEGNLLVAKIKGQANYETQKDKTTSITKQSFEIDPTDANDIIRILLKADFKKWIVIEDFHYLSEDVQKFLAADLKAFYEKTDLIRVLVIGVWLESGKLTKLNGDLEGRIEYINADTWNEKELLEILSRGEELLNIKLSLTTKDKMVFYCQNNVGLLQQIAESICDNIGITKTQSNVLLILDDNESSKYMLQTNTSASDVNEINFDNMHILARNFGVLSYNEKTKLNFQGGSIDKWLAQLSEERAHRYTSFLRDFSYGPESIVSNVFRWIIYAVIKSSISDLKSGLSIKQIYSLAKTVVKDNLSGNYSIYSHDIRLGLNEIRNFHQELNITPPILDYDATEDLLRVVDSGFLLYHSTNTVNKMMEKIGFDSNN